MPINVVTPPDTELDMKSSPLSNSSTLTDLKQFNVEDIKPEVDSDTAEELQKRVDETIRRVREQSDRLQEIALPYAQKTRDFAEERPVLFTFLVIFTVLSAIPLACFATFLLMSTIFVVGIAAIGVCLSILGTVLFATSILLPVLLFTVLASTMILSFLLFLFLGHRLYLHLAINTKSGQNTDLEHITQGVRTWADETKGRVDLSSLGLKGKVRWADQINGGKWINNVKQEGEVTGLRLRGVGQGQGIST